uniref:Ubiquitin carboxyl-terminal hydrolase n=3 Tax=Parascaris univalens TaxID=6257 RepID=A0A914ZRI4_PARUN
EIRTSGTMTKVQWLPLESNPEVITNFMHKMGVETGVECVDVLGFDDDLLALLPHPCYALILCFPDYKKVDELMAPIYEKQIAERGKIPGNIFFMKQKIPNACGTFALIHCLANNRDKINLGSGALKQWLDKALTLDVDERSDSLAFNEELEQAHESCARSGETEPERESPIEHHFICFINMDGTLYEIDSRAPFPRACGPTSESTFLKDAGQVCQQLMSKLDNVSFSALAIVRSS